jgi:hypothetical protein
MQPTPAFGYQQLVTELIRGVVDTVADKPELSPERRAAAQQTVVCTVMSYNPRDAVETMLAGQCVVYDAMLRDGARDMLRGQSELMKIKARPGILSAGKMFLATMEMAVRMQGRGADQLAFARPVEAPAAPVETPAAATHSVSEAPPASTPDAAAQPADASAPAEERHPEAFVRPLMSDQMVEEILVKGLSPEEQQEIRAAAARATHRPIQPVPITAHRGSRS